MRAEWGVGALLYMGAARGCFCGVFWAETLRWDCGGVETEVLRFIQGVGRAVARWKQPAGEAARETVCSRHTEDGFRAGRHGVREVHAAPALNRFLEPTTFVVVSKKRCLRQAAPPGPLIYGYREGAA